MVKLLITVIIPFLFGMSLLVAFVVLVFQIAKEIVDFRGFLKENYLFGVIIYPICFLLSLFFMFIFYPVCVDIWLEVNKIEIRWLNEYVSYLYSFM